MAKGRILHKYEIKMFYNKKEHLEELRAANMSGLLTQVAALFKNLTFADTTRTNNLQIEISDKGIVQMEAN